MIMSGRIDISDGKEIASLKSVASNKNKNIPKPLEDMKGLFYQDKAVEIINLPRQSSSENFPSRKQKNKNDNCS